MKTTKFINTNKKKPLRIRGFLRPVTGFLKAGNPALAKSILVGPQ
jgi:hypothetical protein